MMTPNYQLHRTLLYLVFFTSLSSITLSRKALSLLIIFITLSFTLSSIQAQTQKRIKVLDERSGNPIRGISFVMNQKTYKTDENGEVMIDESQASAQVTEIKGDYLIKQMYPNNNGINILVRKEREDIASYIKNNKDLKKLVDKLNNELKQKEQLLNISRVRERELEEEIAKLNIDLEARKNSDEVISVLNSQKTREEEKGAALIDKLDSLRAVNKETQEQISLERVKVKLIENARETEKIKKEKELIVKQNKIDKQEAQLIFAILIAVSFVAILLVILFFVTRKNYKEIRVLNEELHSLNEDLKVKIEELKRKKELEKAYKTITQQHLDLLEKTEELKSSEKNLKSTADALELKTQDLERLQSEKEKFTRMIVHDFKTPLSTLISSQSNHDDMKLAAKHIQTYVQDLHDVYQFERGEFKVAKDEYDLHYVSTEVVTMLKSEAMRKGLKLQNLIPEKSMAIFDKGVLGRVLMNLVSNAIKYTDEGEIKINIEERENKLRVSVEDTGKGIAYDKQEDIFKPFVSLNGVSFAGIGAMGIGLSFCKMALSKHNSNIMLDSKPAQGACFYFDLERGRDYNPSQNQVIQEDEEELEISRIKALIQNLMNDSEIKDEIEGNINTLKNIKWYNHSEIKRAIEAINDKNEIITTWKTNLLKYREKNYKKSFQDLITFDILTK